MPSKTSPERIQRIHVTGNSGSGKSTVAARIAQRLGVPHIELDAINWQAGWTALETEPFRARVADATAGQGWVVDGNYSEVRSTFRPRCQVVLFLDIPLWLSLARLFRRSFQRSLGRQELWNGNREDLWNVFFSRDSLIGYTLSTHKRRRADYEYSRRDPANQHITFLRLKNQQQIEQFIASLPQSTAS